MIPVLELVRVSGPLSTLVCRTFDENIDIAVPLFVNGPPVVSESTEGQTLIIPTGVCVRVERGAVGWVVARSGSVELLHGARIMNSIIGPADGETEVHVRLQCRFWPTTKAVYATLEDLRNRQIAIAQVLFFPHILPMVACDPGLMTNP